MEVAKTVTSQDTTSGPGETQSHARRAGPKQQPAKRKQQPNTCCSARAVGYGDVSTCAFSCHVTVSDYTVRKGHQLFLAKAA